MRVYDGYEPPWVLNAISCSLNSAVYKMMAEGLFGGSHASPTGSPMLPMLDLLLSGLADEADGLSGSDDLWTSCLSW